MILEERKRRLERLIKLSELQEKYFEELYKYGMMLIKLNKKWRKKCEM